MFVPAAGAQPPAPNAPLPRDPSDAAAALVQTTRELYSAIDAWRPKVGKPPSDVMLEALYQQRLVRWLAHDASFARKGWTSLPAASAAYVRDVVTAHLELVRLTPPLKAPRIRVGAAAPPSALLSWYREGERRYKVPWNVLAAVNFVESAFGKLRNASAAGAQGPMQFIPATWRRYGLGGDVHDPHDAIVGAANYLHRSGAPKSLRRALFAYNPSGLYVDAVLRYARQIRADAHAYYAFYSWQVFVRTASGVRRVTGPGLS